MSCLAVAPLKRQSGQNAMWDDPRNCGQTRRDQAVSGARASNLFQNLGNGSSGRHHGDAKRAPVTMVNTGRNIANLDVRTTTSSTTPGPRQLRVRYSCCMLCCGTQAQVLRTRSSTDVRCGRGTGETARDGSCPDERKQRAKSLVSSRNTG